MRKRMSHFHGCRVAKYARARRGSSFSLSECFIFLFFSLRVTSRGSERAASQECRYDFFGEGGARPLAVRAATMALQPCRLRRIHMIHYYP